MATVRFPRKILKILLVAYAIVIVLFLIVPEDRAAEHYVEGIHHLRNGRYEKAISEFTRAIKIEPRDIKSCRYRGVAYAKKGDLDQAIRDFTTAIEKNPRSALDHTYRGNAYRAKREYDLAIQDYNKAIEIRPTHFEAYSERAQVHKDRGEHDLATEDQKKAIELEADYHYKSGEFLYERLKASGDKAVVSGADYHYENGIWVYRPSGNRHESDVAISDYTKAIEMHAKYSKAYVNRAAIYYMKGEYDKAWEDVHKAEESGHQVPVEFLTKLREASGRDN